MARHVTNPSRRSFAITAAAAAITPLPVAAVTLAVAPDTDPIFAVIRAHRQAMRDYTAAVVAASKVEESLPREKRTWYSTITDPEPPDDCTDPPEWIACQIGVREACDDLDDSLLAVLTTEPTSISGVAAVLGHVGLPVYPDDLVFADQPQPMPHALNPSILADAGQATNDTVSEAATAFLLHIADVLRRLLGMEA